MECVEFEYEKKYMEDFLKLPKILYTKWNNTENYKDIKNILLGKHMLLKYIDKLHKFVIYDDKGKVAGRFAITTVKDDGNAYLGFFECIKDDKVAKFLFDNATEFVKKLGYNKIIGPVDLNMWQKYRLKINRFDLRPYTGEPYNLEYYYKMFLDNGFGVKDKYYSNSFNRFSLEYDNPKYTRRYEYFRKNGYEIRSIKMDEWDSAIEQVYELIMRLYSGFNTFVKLDKEDFIEQFNSYKKILDLDLVIMAYYEGKIVGFSIGIPNYNNAVYNLSSISNLMHILKIKKKADEYMITYMGVAPEHRGLARAITYLTIEELKKRNATSMGALIREGTVTNNFAKDMLNFSYEYVLMEKNVQ